MSNDSYIRNHTRRASIDTRTSDEGVDQQIRRAVRPTPPSGEVEPVSASVPRAELRSTTADDWIRDESNWG